MPNPLLSVAVDAESVLAALAAVGEEADALILAASKVTAEAIASETSRRFARASGGPTRGGAHTAEGITTEVMRVGGVGYVVYVKSPNMPGLPGWLEFGTVKMVARPALFASARLEESNHLRRVSDALQAAIDHRGLGE